MSIEIDKGNTSQDKFKELLGDGFVYFNKDASQRTLFALRKQVLAHEDSCECDTCTKIALLNELGIENG